MQHLIVRRRKILNRTDSTAELRRSFTKIKWECLRSRRKKVKQLTGGWSPSLGYSDASSGCSGCSSLYRLRTQGSSARSSASRLRSVTPGRRRPLESDAPTGWWLGAVSTHEWSPDPWARCCSRAWSRVGRSWCLISLCFISKVEERYMVGLEFSLLIYVPMKMRMKFGLDARREKNRLQQQQWDRVTRNRWRNYEKSLFYRTNNRLIAKCAKLFETSIMTTERKWQRRKFTESSRNSTHLNAGRPR